MPAGCTNRLFLGKGAMLLETLTLLHFVEAGAAPGVNYTDAYLFDSWQGIGVYTKTGGGVCLMGFWKSDYMTAEC